MTARIQVEGLSKRYRLGARGGARSTLRETIMGLPRRLASSLTGSAEDPDAESFWALDDVSFEVGPGEALGVVGANGAGKTTLLKLLSRITEPTRGRAVLRGRVGSLLEVGTGFHNELSGRENIFLSGAILGLRRREIEQKFDEIVAFAGVERFLDTPVKRYSSGMYVRLGFAIAAHLEPEILVVDEVLAVGDARFQKKCLGKMGEVARDEGRTVLFVSHNMTSVRQLCTRAIQLEGGKLVADGPAEEVVARYLRCVSETHLDQEWEFEQAPGNEKVRLKAARLVPGEGDPLEMSVLTPFQLVFEYWNLQPEALLNLSVSLYNLEGLCVFTSTTVLEPEWHGKPFPKGLFRSVCEVPGHFLNEGHYTLVLRLVEDSRYVLYQDDNVLSFSIKDTPVDRGGWFGKWSGAVRPRLEWTTAHLEEGE